MPEGGCRMPEAGSRMPDGGSRTAEGSARLRACTLKRVHFPDSSL